MGGKTDEGAEVTPSSPSPIAGKSGKEHVERIELRGVTAKADACVEKCVLEASWSDSSSSTVSKSLQEVQEFFSQVSQLFPEERLENLQPLMPGVDSTQELDLRCFASLPPHVLKHDKVRLFFSTSSAPPLANSTNVGCLLQFRGARPVCGVASIRPVLGLHTPLTPGCPACLPHLQPHTTVLPIMPSAAGEGGPHAHPVAPPQPQPRPSQPCPEQSGILDWLRKLRLHKYYPVFKQLTMEEFLALTEEDLNKYDLTQGAKKKLKTQLELQKEKLEKRYTLSQFPIACGGGVARVTPSSHIHTATHTHPGCSSAELRVEVENSAAMLLPLDSGSSSGYSSAPSSPMTPLSRDLSFDRVKRAEACGLDPGAEKERTCFLLNPAPSGPARPTAQVLPVQNDPNFCLPPPSLSFLPSGRIISAPRKPRPPPQGTEERPKPAAVRLENLFPALSLDSSPAHQEAPGPRGPFSGGVLYSPARPPGVPVAATPGNTYSVGATPSATPTPASTEGSRPPSASLCVCSSCGCGGGCGSYGTLPSSYVPHFSGTSVFTLGPLLHFSSSPFSYPLVAPPLYGSQQGLVLPPVQGFVGGGVYQPLGMLGNGSAALKKGGNASCYNCGVSGHRAQDCKQPAMDSAQQGSFRLKYSPQSDSQDSGD